MFTSSHYQLIAQLILKLEEGSAICSWGSRCNGDLVGKNLNEGFSYWLMGAGIAYMDLQRYFCNDKQPQWLLSEKLLWEAAVRTCWHTNDWKDTSSDILVPRTTFFTGLKFSISGSHPSETLQSLLKPDQVLNYCPTANFSCGGIYLPPVTHMQLGSTSQGQVTLPLRDKVSITDYCCDYENSKHVLSNILC